MTQWKPQPRPILPDELATILELYASGVGVTAIGRQLGRGHAAIRRALEYGGARPRVQRQGQALPHRKCLRCKGTIRSRYPGLCSACRKYANTLSPLEP